MNGDEGGLHGGDYCSRRSATSVLSQAGLRMPNANWQSAPGVRNDVSTALSHVNVPAPYIPPPSLQTVCETKAVLQQVLRLSDRALT